MNYLFLDIECANCFGGIGKMCSFGYVLTDADFNILESQDIVMNPDSEFDWYLYKNKDDIKLAYSQSFFRSQPNFPNHYDKIKKLVLDSDTKIFGFGVLGDIGFVTNACERYEFPLLHFSAFDLERIIKSEDEIFGSLDERCKILGIDNSDLQAHKSCDDAIMTMRLLKAFLQKTNTSIEDIMKNKMNCFSTKDFLRKRASRQKKKERQARFAEYRKNNNRNTPKTGSALKRRRSDSKTITFD